MTLTTSRELRETQQGAKNMEIPYTLAPGAYSPTQDAPPLVDLNLYAMEEVTIPTFSQAPVRTGVSMAIPEGTIGSLSVEPGLVTTDTVNPGDTSEIIITIGNTGSPVTIHPGDLVARLAIHPDPRVKFIKVNELPAAPDPYWVYRPTPTDRKDVNE